MVRCRCWCGQVQDGLVVDTRERMPALDGAFVWFVRSTLVPFFGGRSKVLSAFAGSLLLAACACFLRGEECGDEMFALVVRCPAYLRRTLALVKLPCC